MQTILTGVFSVIFFLLVAVVVYTWFIAFISLSRLPSYKKPEVPWTDIPFGTRRPQQIALTPRHLTEEGKACLRRLIVHGLICLAAGICIPIIAIVWILLG